MSNFQILLATAMVVTLTCQLLEWSIEVRDLSMVDWIVENLADIYGFISIGCWYVLFLRWAGWEIPAAIIMIVVALIVNTAIKAVRLPILARKVRSRRFIWWVDMIVGCICIGLVWGFGQQPMQFPLLYPGFYYDADMISVYVWYVVLLLAGFVLLAIAGAMMFPHREVLPRGRNAYPESWMSLYKYFYRRFIRYIGECMATYMYAPGVLLEIAYILLLEIVRVIIATIMMTFVTIVKLVYRAFKASNRR